MVEELLKFKPEVKNCTLTYTNDIFNIYWDGELIMTSESKPGISKIQSYFEEGLRQRLSDKEQLPTEVKVKKESNWFTSCPSGKYWEDEPYTAKSDKSLGDYKYYNIYEESWVKSKKKYWNKEEIVSILENFRQNPSDDIVKWVDENLQKYV